MKRSVYTSDFEDECGKVHKRSSWRDDTLAKCSKTSSTDHSARMPARSSFIDAYEKEEKKTHFAQFLSLSAYGRHKKLVHDYLAFYGGNLEEFKRSSKNDKTDFDVIKENHKFIWEEEDEENSWGKQLAKKYYDKLFKEYCICDLTRYKENKIAMRWRVEKEVIEGRGQFSCGSRKCNEADGLKSWEVNFGYVEHGEKKQALVKLRLCKDCSYKLNYTKKHKKAKKKRKKAKRATSSSDESSEGDGDQGHTKATKQPTEVCEPAVENIWNQPAKQIEVEKSREEEFDAFLEDLFL